MAKLAKQEVKKHVAAIHISSDLSLLQRKLVNVFLFNAYNELLTKRKHKILIPAACSLCGFNSNNRDFFIEAVNGVMTKVIEWNLLDKQGGAIWEAMPILSYVRVESKTGECTYSFPEELCKKLYQPEIYSKIKLEIQRYFKSNYALTLYENCYRFKDNDPENNGYGITPWIDIETFKKLMGVHELKFYQQYKELNRKIIKPSVEEVNKHSDVTLKVEIKRESRKVIAVRFKIYKKQQQYLPLEIEDDLVNKPLLNRLMGFGLTQQQAIKILCSHEENYIKENLDIVEERNRKGEIKKNLTGYTLSALEKDYRPKMTEEELKTKKAKAKKEQEEIKKKEKEIAKVEEDKLKRKNAEIAFKNLSVSKQKALKKEFETTLKGILADNYQKNGLNSIGVKIQFYSFVARKIL